MYNKITSFRSILNLFLMVSMFSLTANAQTIVFSEDFSSITLGNSTESTGSSTAWDGNTNFTVDPVNSKAYQAGGAVRLGTGSVKGFITTMPINLSQGGGAFTVTFDVKGWSAAGSLKVILLDQADVVISEQTVTYTNTMSGTNIGPFESKTLNFTGGVANAKLRFETLADPTASRRAYIDNVVVTVATVTPPPAAPVATAATLPDVDSFIANWEAVTGATGYRLDVSTVSDFTSFVTGYENMTVTGTSQEITGLTQGTPYYYRVRAVNGTSTSANSNVITANTNLVAPVATAATVVENDSFTANWQPVAGATGYRLDVSTTADFSSFVGTYNDFVVAGTQTSQVVTGLSSYTTYYYRVRAINANDTSDNSNVIAVTTDCGPFTLPDLTTQAFCAGSTVANLPLAGTAGYQWFTTQSGGTALVATEVLSEGTYFLMQTVNNCESNREALTVTITTTPAPTFTDPEFEVCNSGTIADITTEGSGYLFYTAQTGGTALAPTTAVQNGFLWVSQTVNGCESLTRTQVEVEIEVPVMPTGEAEQEFTEGDTLEDLVVTVVEDLLWFQDEALSTVLAATTPLEDGVTYYAVNNDGGCYSLPLAVTANEALATGNFTMSGLVNYPNPVKDVFTVSYTAAITNVTVYNMLSQAVINADYNSTSAQVNMSGLAAGTYFVKVVSGAESKTIKVVKQ